MSKAKEAAKSTDIFINASHKTRAEHIDRSSSWHECEFPKYESIMNYISVLNCVIVTAAEGKQFIFFSGACTDWAIAEESGMYF